MSTNLAAYTMEGTNPAYISINRQDDGYVAITVRSIMKRGGMMGDTGVITLSPATYQLLLDRLNNAH